jgi:hypothetical protein
MTSLRVTYLKVRHDDICKTFREFRLAIFGREGSERELWQNCPVLGVRLWELSASELCRGRRIRNL